MDRSEVASWAASNDIAEPTVAAFAAVATLGQKDQLASAPAESYSPVGYGHDTGALASYQTNAGFGWADPPDVRSRSESAHVGDRSGDVGPQDQGGGQGDESGELLHGGTPRCRFGSGAHTVIGACLTAVSTPVGDGSNHGFRGASGRPTGHGGLAGGTRPRWQHEPPVSRNCLLGRPRRGLRWPSPQAQAIGMEATVGRLSGEIPWS